MASITRFIFSERFIILFWGGLLIASYFQPLTQKLLHPMFRPGLCVAGIILLLVAIISKNEHDHHCHDNCQHHSPHSPPRLLKLIWLTLPALFAFVLISDGFSYKDLGAQNPYHQEKFINDGAHINLPPVEIIDDEVVDDYRSIDIVDLNLIAENLPLREKWRGKKIKVDGMWLTTEEKDQNRLMRVFIFCCFADALPVSIGINSTTLPAPPKRSWITVRGKLEFSDIPARSAPLPVIIAETYTRIAEPPDPYIWQTLGRRRLELLLNEMSE